MAWTIGDGGRRVRGRTGRLLATVALLVGAAGAEAGTVILHTDLSSVVLTGTGVVPLAGSATPGEYALVEALVDVRQPDGLISSGTTTITVDPVNGTVGFHSSFAFHLDVTLTEVTPGDFHPGLGGEVRVPADSGDPLTAMLAAEFAFADLLAILDGSVSPTITSDVSTRTYPLGVDINGDGLDDTLSFDALDINFLDEEDVSFDLGVGTTVDDILGAILAATLNDDGEPLVLTGNLSIAALSVEFLGSVNPPFNVALSGSIGAAVIPVPPALVLLASATLALGCLRRRRRSA